VHPLLDVDGEREEVDPLAGVAGGARGEDLRLADGDDRGAARQLGELAGLERYVGAPDRAGGVGVWHLAFLLWCAPSAGKADGAGCRAGGRPVVSGGPPGRLRGWA